VAFLLPFLLFLWRGWIGRSLGAQLWMIFGLGAVQGAVGWWMVTSGLTDRVSVSQYRLAFHLTLACVIYAAIVWTLARLTERPIIEAPKRIRASAFALTVLVLVQIYLGALVAGLDAGLTYNTWPLIDGALVPAGDRLWFLAPLWRNVFENDLMVQFNHRIVAYVLLVAAVVHALDVMRNFPTGFALRGALALAGTITLQAAIGVLTLLLQTPVALALMHQALAIVVLTIAVIHVERLVRRPMSATVTRPAAAS
jgi:heme a synthase